MELGYPALHANSLLFEPPRKPLCKVAVICIRIQKLSFVSGNRFKEMLVKVSKFFTDNEVIVTQSCLTLCEPMDCSLPGSFVYGILQARILEWVSISFPGDLPNAVTEPGSPSLQAESLPIEQRGKLH